ncbi:hypothetical protein FRC08_010777, partial [Ceratobasidium sp. 394]
MLIGTVSFALAAALAATAQSSITISVTANATHAIPSTLYGYMWEDINHSGDGGLYGELLQNRAFQAVTPGTSASLAGWAAYNGASITVVNSTPGVSTALPNSLQVTVPSSATAAVGFQNTGYWGIRVQSGWAYTGSLYVKSTSYTGSVTVSLVSLTSGQTFATQTLKSSTPTAWTKLSFGFTPTASASDTNNVLRVTVDGASAKGQKLNFGLLSLFPPTYKNRANGMRVDLAETLAATSPKVWRFPGGNNVEGTSIDNRWKWYNTIGPLENRTGRFGNWGYPNTDGLGLMEYLNWAEDLGAEPILGVWGDYGNLSTFPVVPESQIQP